MKTALVKAINKRSHLKMISRYFLSKIKKNLKKKFIFVKIAVGKEQPAILIKLTQKIVKFCRICQLTEAVIVNVKHKFHLESR